ncbi:MAG: GNAT family N-acetyltransferase [Candidatus Dormibacteraeota bacterium]|nr:GNAT family N-acetyltransferase [Candidatus Dormibacteraeota bacterium]
MELPEVEMLSESDLRLIKPLLVELQLYEQPHFADHPQLSAGQIDEALDVRPVFRGENVVFACRDDLGGISGFCWVVLFDPGTGLEGELAEVYVAPAHRGRGVGEALVRRAVQLFEQRGVTLGYVWTRPDNEPALRLYVGSGFEPTQQLILTWYPGGIGAGGQRPPVPGPDHADEAGPASGRGPTTKLDR